jgi:hypothetical protein
MPFNSGNDGSNDCDDVAWRAISTRSYSGGARSGGGGGGGGITGCSVGEGAGAQGLTLVHIRAQLEQLKGTLMSQVGLHWCLT